MGSWSRSIRFEQNLVFSIFSANPSWIPRFLTIITSLSLWEYSVNLNVWFWRIFVSVINLIYVDDRTWLDICEMIVSPWKALRGYWGILVNKKLHHPERGTTTTTMVLTSLAKFLSICLFRMYRLCSYRVFTSWLYGRLGAHNRRVIPACVVRAIRAQYPNSEGVEYTGFSDASSAWPWCKSHICVVFTLFKSTFLIHF